MDSRTERASAVLARRIGEIRERQGLTKQALADRLGMDRATVHRIETGERKVLIDELLRIAAALNVSPVNLVIPPGEFDHVLVGNVPVNSHQARAWWRGFTPVEGYLIVGEDGEEQDRIPGLDTDERIFYSGVSDDEWHAFRTPGVRELLDECMALVHTANRVTRGDDDADPGLLAFSFRRLARIAAHHADLIDEQEA